jgi:hypothetical protein
MQVSSAVAGYNHVNAGVSQISLEQHASRQTYGKFLSIVAVVPDHV